MLMSGETNTTSTITALTGAVSDLVGGGSLPAPISRNALKAFNELCSAAIDIPVAKLQGKAAEIRAESNARISLIKNASTSIADQMQVDKAYAELAAEKYGRRILQQQLNLDSVCGFTASEIKRMHNSRSSSAESADSDSSDAEADASCQPEISDDWLNGFREEAMIKSSEEMRLIFGKILAGEIVRPGSFSLRSIKIMGQLDAKSATLFRRLCSLCISLRPLGSIFDARVPSLGGNAGSNCLQDFGLSLDNLNLLQEYGLIIPDYNSFLDYRASVVFNSKVGCPFWFGDKQYVLIPTDTNEWPGEKQFKIHGIGLSAAGRELLGIVEIAEDRMFSEAFAKFINDSGLIAQEFPCST